MINRTSIILYKENKTQSERKYFLHNRINQFCCLYSLFIEECKWLILFDSTVELMAPYYHWLVPCLFTPLSGSSLSTKPPLQIYHYSLSISLPSFKLYLEHNMPVSVQWVGCIMHNEKNLCWFNTFEELVNCYCSLSCFRFLAATLFLFSFVPCAE